MQPQRRYVLGPKKRGRVRRSVARVYNQLGPTCFLRAHRMKYESFSKLVDLLVPLLAPIDCSKAHVKGFISNSVRLAVTLRYFARGSAYDTATTYGISFSEVFVHVRRIVNAVNQNPRFNIKYPKSHSKQLKILQKGLKRFQEPVLSAVLVLVMEC